MSAMHPVSGGEVGSSIHLVSISAPQSDTNTQCPHGMSTTQLVESVLGATRSRRLL
jgi:hypothetical protein